MAKYYYNGVLLPEIPVIEGYSYTFIRKDETNGYYDLIYSIKKPCYAETNIGYVTDGTIGTGDTHWYRIEIASASTATVWAFNKVIETWWVINAERTVMWSNVDMPVGSEASTDIYFNASEPIAESAKIELIKKIEAEIGVLSGSAVITDRSELSGNIVVDGITKSSGSFSLDFNVPKSGYYVIKMYYTHSGERGFKYALNGLTYLKKAVGTSYYSIGSTEFQMYLNEGINTVVFSGYFTDYAPMFDYFEIYKITLYDKKYLIRSISVIYTIIDDILTPLQETELSANVFKTYGLEEVPAWESFSTLSSPEVLYWQDSEDDLPTLTATVTATPHPQTVISLKCDLSDVSITGIESMLATCEGELICAVSFDDKATWKAHNGAEWVTLSDEYVGMSKETLEAITLEQWNELYSDTSGLYIRLALNDTTQSVTKIEIDFSN